MEAAPAARRPRLRGPCPNQASPGDSPHLSLSKLPGASGGSPFPLALRLAARHGSRSAWARTGGFHRRPIAPITSCGRRPVPYQLNEEEHP